MTSQEIINRLQAIADELKAINCSEDFKAIADHPEFSCGDVNLSDALIGVRDTLDAIDYVMDFEIMKMLPDCLEEEENEQD